MNGVTLFGAGLLAIEQRRNDTGIRQIDLKLLNTCSAQAGLSQFQNLEIGLHAPVAVDFRTQLKRLASGMRTIRAGVHNRAAVTQPGDRTAPEQVSVNACHLRCGVSAQPQGTSRELIDQFEGLQIQGLTGTGEQGFDVLEQRRHHQLVAVAAGGVEQFTSEFFDMACLGRQHIGDVIR